MRAHRWDGTSSAFWFHRWRLDRCSQAEGYGWRCCRVRSRRPRQALISAPSGSQKQTRFDLRCPAGAVCFDLSQPKRLSGGVQVGSRRFSLEFASRRSVLFTQLGPPVHRYRGNRAQLCFVLCGCRGVIGSFGLLGPQIAHPSSASSSGPTEPSAVRLSRLSWLR